MVSALRRRRSMRRCHVGVSHDTATVQRGWAAMCLLPIPKPEWASLFGLLFSIVVGPFGRVETQFRNTGSRRWALFPRVGLLWGGQKKHESLEMQKIRKMVRPRMHVVLSCCCESVSQLKVHRTHASIIQERAPHFLHCVSQHVRHGHQKKKMPLKHMFRVSGNCKWAPGTFEDQGPHFG